MTWTLALLGAATLAACGNNNSPDGSSAPPAVVAGPTPTEVPEQASPSAAATVEDPVKAEDNPPGDIPDNLAFIVYHSASGKYAFKHPEGWALVKHGTAVTFTDKLNGFHVELGTLTAPPTVAAAKTNDVPMLKSSQAAFELRKVSAFTVGSASGVKIVYRRNSTPDPVTGKQYRDEVERYELVSGGRELIIELYGPVGADNVDAYRMMLDSLKFS